MALQTFSPGCTSLTTAAARTRLPGTTRNRLLLVGSTAASGRVAVAALLPAVASCMRAAASARTRCSGADEAVPTPEPLTLSTLYTALGNIEKKLCETNPPRREDVNKIINSNCMGLIPMIKRIILLDPADDRIPEWIKTSIEETERVLHNESKAENPWADPKVMLAAINGVRKLREICLKVSKSLKKSMLAVRMSLALFPANEASANPLTADTFDTLVAQLSHWLEVDNRPKCKKDFLDIAFIASKCKYLYPRMVYDFRIVPVHILEEIMNIYISKFVKLREESDGKFPRAPDASAIEDAIKGVKRMKEIFMVPSHQRARLPTRSHP